MTRWLLRAAMTLLAAVSAVATLRCAQGGASIAYAVLILGFVLGGELGYFAARRSLILAVAGAALLPLAFEVAAYVLMTGSRFPDNGCIEVSSRSGMWLVAMSFLGFALLSIVQRRPGWLRPLPFGGMLCVCTYLFWLDFARLLGTW